MAMPIEAPTTDRILLRVDEVDMKNRLVHAADRTGANIQASFGDLGGVTSIPMSGDKWTARREGYIWHLENRLDAVEEQEFISTLSPGDAVISTPGTLYLKGGSVTLNDTIFSLPWYNVMDYGAVGDGVADDRAALQEAIDLAIANGGMVYLPPGTYRITAALDFSGMRDTNKAVKFWGQGRGDAMSGTLKGTTIIKNDSTGPAIKAYGILSGATNKGVLNLELRDFSVENLQNIGTNWTIDMDYVIAGCNLWNIYINGKNLGGNGLRYMNYAHGQAMIAGITVRNFSTLTASTGTGFRFSAEVTANVDTAPNSGNLHISHCSAINCQFGWIFTGTNLTNGYVLTALKAVRVTETSGSIGFEFRSQFKASTGLALHSESYETGFYVNASEMNTFTGCISTYNGTPIDANTAGWRFGGTSATGNSVFNAHTQSHHYGCSFEDNARTNFFSGKDRTGARVITSMVRDISTLGTNRFEIFENDPFQIDFGVALIDVARRAGTNSVFRSGINTDADGRFKIFANGQFLWNGDGSSTYDTTFGWVAANKLGSGSDDDIAARSGAAGETMIGGIGPSSEAGVSLGSAHDAKLYRVAANRVKTDSSIQVAPASLPTSPSSGEMAYDPASNTMVMWNGKFWQPMLLGAGGTQTIHAWLHSDFHVMNTSTGASADGDFQNVSAGTGAGVVNAGSGGFIGKSVGLAHLDTGTTAAGSSYFSSRNPDIHTDTTEIDLVYVMGLIYIDILSTGAQQFHVGVGVSNNPQTIANAGSNNGWGFRYNEAASSGAWQCLTYDGDGAVSVHFTGETVAADKWYQLECLWDRNAATLQWWINDSLIGTLSSITPGTTADFPSANDMRPYIGIEKTAGLTERQLHVDMMTTYIRNSGTRAGLTT